MSDAHVDLFAGVRRGEKSAVAAALNLVEDRRAAAREDIVALLDAVRGGDGHRVGLTGPPGVGKSTLCAAVARELRARALTVGILAIDPSSVRSGGALLGDRARMGFDPTDEGVLVRSIATAGQAGGLSDAAPAAAEILAAAYDVVLIETTGVGQSEIDVGWVADTTVMVVQPGSGDALQFLKAGIMEIPDLFVVNKADLGDRGELADRAMSDLKSALSAAVHVGAAEERPVLRTSATTGGGVEALVDALRECAQDSTRAARRRQCEVHWAVSSFLREHGHHGVRTLGGLEAIRCAAAALLEDLAAPAVSRTLSARFLSAVS